MPCTEDIHKRPEIKPGWQKEFPYYVTLNDETKVGGVARFLVAVAYPRSVKKRGKKHRPENELSSTNFTRPDEPEFALLDEPEFALPEELLENTSLHEGSYREIKVNIYERNPEARRKCIKKFGAICWICKFDFEIKYGPMGKGYIHVHHLIPLSSIREDYVVNPLTDLRPVCPNCHAMIHCEADIKSCESIASLIAKCDRS